MGFVVFDQSLKRLNFKPVEDSITKKLVEVYLEPSIGFRGHFTIHYRFRWKKTINLSAGDTDHFRILGCSKVEIRLNFPEKLKLPTCYMIKDREIKSEKIPSCTTEKDGSVIYRFEMENKENYDGIVFYFEGKSMDAHEFSSPKALVSSRHPHRFQAKSTEYYMVGPCQDSDIRSVYRIESAIEHGNAATEEILFERLRMFRDGFLVVRHQQTQEVVGYLECIVWKDLEFSRFDEISDFPIHYDPGGDCLYIIFVAVERLHRGKHLGLELIRMAEKLARDYDLKRIKLVAKDNLIGFYQKNGFSYRKELPHFLSHGNHKSVLMEKPMQ